MKKNNKNIWVIIVIIGLIIISNGSEKKEAATGGTEQWLKDNYCSANPDAKIYHCPFEIAGGNHYCIDTATSCETSLGEVLFPQCTQVGDCQEECTNLYYECVNGKNINYRRCGSDQGTFATCDTNKGCEAGEGVSYTTEQSTTSIKNELCTEAVCDEADYCSGDVLNWCLSGNWYTQDCNEENKVCRVLGGLAMCTEEGNSCSALGGIIKNQECVDINMNYVDNANDVDYSSTFCCKEISSVCGTFFDDCSSDLDCCQDYTCTETYYGLKCLNLTEENIEETCVDSDGEEDDNGVYVKGTATSSLSGSFVDECIGDSKLIEYYCKSDKTVGYNQYYCSCSNGKCAVQTTTEPETTTPAQETTTKTDNCNNQCLDLIQECVKDGGEYECKINSGITIIGVFIGLALLFKTVFKQR